MSRIGLHASRYVREPLSGSRNSHSCAFWPTQKKVSTFPLKPVIANFGLSVSPRLQCFIEDQRPWPYLVGDQIRHVAITSSEYCNNLWGKGMSSENSPYRWPLIRLCIILATVFLSTTCARHQTIRDPLLKKSTTWIPPPKCFSQETPDASQRVDTLDFA